VSARFLASLGALTVVIALAGRLAVISATTLQHGRAGALAPLSVAGQAAPFREDARTSPATKTWTPPLTPFGQPDLEGIWVNNSATPLERPAALAGKVSLTDDEVAELKRRADRLFNQGNSAFAVGDTVFLAAYANLDRYDNPNSTGSSVWMVEKEFENRTSMIEDPPDGRIPPLTPLAQQRQRADAARQRLAAAAEELGNAVRCITYGVPRFGGRYADADFGYFQILQAPGYIVLIMEAIHDARIIPLDGRPHLPQGVRQWNGDPRGRWDGNTLVVDTTNFSAKSNFMGSAENLHLVERFTRVAPDVISYEITISDPTTWTMPWTAVIRLKQTQNKIYEFACHEGNLSMPGILNGARAEERPAEGGPQNRRPGS
jgi:hypothetical protein